MIIDLTEKFVKDNAIPENGESENPPKVIIEVDLCYRKAADLYDNLKKIYTIMLDNQ